MTQMTRTRTVCLEEVRIGLTPTLGSDLLHARSKVWT